LAIVQFSAMTIVAQPSIAVRVKPKAKFLM